MKHAALALLTLFAACSPPLERTTSGDTPVAAPTPPERLREPHAATLRSHAEPRASTSAASEPQASAPAPAHEATGRPVAQRPAHALRVDQLVGSVRSDAPVAIAVAAELPCATTLALAAGAVLTLSLDDYVRLVLYGPLTAQVLPAGEPALLLREGRVSVDVAPRGVRGPHSAFWLATPLARVDVADSARLYVRVENQGAGELAVVSGHAQLARADGAQLLAAVQAHCIGVTGLTRLSRPFATLEQARQAFSRGPSCAPQEVDALASRQRELAAWLDTTQQQSDRQDAQLVEHSRLVEKDPAGALALRKTLASSAAELARGRVWVIALRTQLSAALLARTPSDSARALFARADSLLLPDRERSAACPPRPTP